MRVVFFASLWWHSDGRTDHRPHPDGISWCLSLTETTQNSFLYKIIINCAYDREKKHSLRLSIAWRHFGSHWRALVRDNTCYIFSSSRAPRSASSTKSLLGRIFGNIISLPSPLPSNRAVLWEPGRRQRSEPTIPRQSLRNHSQDHEECLPVLVGVSIGLFRVHDQLRPPWHCPEKTRVRNDLLGCALRWR